MNFEDDPRIGKIPNDEHHFFNALKDTLDIPIYPGAAEISPNNFGKYLFRLPDKMEQLRGTKYFCSETKLLHFTSLEALFSIINDSSIRMYNLWNSSDEKEYSHAAEIFNCIYDIIGQKAETRIKLAKTNSFISSFTSSKNFLSHYHWKNYGNSYKGVAIEFEIDSEYQMWYKFILSKTHYNKLHDFDALFKSWQDFQLKTAIPNNNIFDIEFNWLLSLYKDKSFHEEDEIRLYLYSDGYHATFPLHFAKYTYPTMKKNSASLDIKYFKLPLCNDSWNYEHFQIGENEDKFWEAIPKIRISKIYIGPDVQTGNLEKFNSFIRNSIKEKTGRQILAKDIKKVQLSLSI